MQGNPEQNARTIHKSNPEHLLVFKAPRGADPQVQSGTPFLFRLHAGTNHESNPEPLIVFKAPPRGQSTSPIQNTSLFLRLHGGTIKESNLNCEILGSYLQQHHQHHVFRAHFEAEPHSQAEANKWQRIFCLISMSKLTDSVVTDNTSLPCSAR